MIELDAKRGRVRPGDEAETGLCGPPATFTRGEFSMSRTRLTRREFMAATGAGLATCGVPRFASASRLTRSDRPNFVIVFLDDCGYRDIGCFGADGYETPHLDLSLIHISEPTRPY